MAGKVHQVFLTRLKLSYLIVSSLALKNQNCKLPKGVHVFKEAFLPLCSLIVLVVHVIRYRRAALLSVSYFALISA